jgi:hypothetical protein
MEWYHLHQVLWTIPQVHHLFWTFIAIDYRVIQTLSCILQEKLEVCSRISNQERFVPLHPDWTSHAEPLSAHTTEPTELECDSLTSQGGM